MDLIKYLPSFYFNSEEVKNIQASVQSEDIAVKEAIKDVLNQLFVDTATWGLNSWEKMLGLKIDTTETLENRRARVMTRLRGTGTVTKSMIKNVCKSFTNGEVDVIENTDYSFTIKFVDIKGIPGNLNYLRDAIEEIKPAHLNFNFEYTYNTHNSLKLKTHDFLKNMTHDQIRIFS